MIFRLRVFLILTAFFVPLSAGGTELTIPAPNYAPDSGFTTINSPGNPSLPAKDLYILLPPDTDISSVSAHLVPGFSINRHTNQDIEPFPPAAANVNGNKTYDWGPGKLISNGRNLKVYSKNDFYPQTNVELIQVGKLRQYIIAHIRYYPLRYNPVSKELLAVSSARLQIKYAQSKSYSITNHIESSSSSEKLRGLVANYNDVSKWYEGSTASGTSIQSSTQSNPPTYAIITTSYIVQNSTCLQQFINHKTARGFRVITITPQNWGGGTGDIAANNIRAYLKNIYLNENIQYALFIGDPSPNTSEVPMKMLWPRNNASTYKEAPSDYFYADLTGNWDLDQDNYYGEQYDDFGIGGIDRFPEIIVGRIPYYGSIAYLDSILQKIINYESGAYNGPWIKKVITTMRPSDSSTPGYHLGEAIKNDAVNPAGFTPIRIYNSSYGLYPPPEVISPPSSLGGNPYQDVLSTWQQHAGFHFWWTHGSESHAVDVFYSYQCSSLDNNFPSFVFSCSCLNGYPEAGYNLGYSLLRNGAIAVESATRVSWYYIGETYFAASDSNASMAYRYAIRLIRERKPCGDAHFEVLLSLPCGYRGEGLWMNHCVFNIYGDPSLRYPVGPAIEHTPLTLTENTSYPYLVQAQVTYNQPLKEGYPCIKWKTDGETSFSTSSMTLAEGSTYIGYIPPQPDNTTVYYYLSAEDSSGEIATSPFNAPSALHSFQVLVDREPPSITHTPLPNSGNPNGPYTVEAQVTDNRGVTFVKLYYNRNNGPYIELNMNLVSGNRYRANIPGPSAFGDVINYYIVATDTSLNSNTTRNPAAGSYSFMVIKQINVAVYNSSTTPPYFYGGSSNAYSSIEAILNEDPIRRFKVTILTYLDSQNLANQDALIFPDNAPSTYELQAVANWFVPGKVIVAMDSSISYGAYSGFLWPSAAGTNGFNAYWDYNSGSNDQKIIASDPITSGYSIGQVIESKSYCSQLFKSKLTDDTVVLSCKSTDPSRVYAAYRDIQHRGRFIALCPFIPAQPTQYSMIREAIASIKAIKTMTITSPNGGEIIGAGSIINITSSTFGNWEANDKVRLEYNTGLDSEWRQVPGAEQLPYNFQSFSWNTSNLPPSESYKIRAKTTDGRILDESDAPFKIFQVITIRDAKFLSTDNKVMIKGAIVTSNIPNYSYIQQPNALVGIRIQYAGSLVLGSSIDAVGRVTSQDGECLFNAENVMPSESPAVAIRPICLTTPNIGGGSLGFQSAVLEYRRIKDLDGRFVLELLPAGGANNIGLLVRVSGKVTAVGPDYFYLDDGGRTSDGSGFVGVKVICGLFEKPAIGSFVTVNAVVTTYFRYGNVYRALVLPSPNSIQIQKLPG